MNVKTKVTIKLPSLERVEHAMDSVRSTPAHPAIEGMFTQWLRIAESFFRRRFFRLAKSGGGGEWAPLAMSTVLARLSGRGGTIRRQRAKALSRVSAADQRLANARGRARLARVRAIGALGGSAENIAEGRQALANLAVVKALRSREKAVKGAGKVSKLIGGAAILIDTGVLVGGLVIGAAGNVAKRIRAGVQYGFGGFASHPQKRRGAYPPSIARLAQIHQTGGGRLPRRPIIVMPDQPTLARMNSAANAAVRKIIQGGGGAAGGVA